MLFKHHRRGIQRSLGFPRFSNGLALSLARQVLGHIGNVLNHVDFKRHAELRTRTRGRGAVAIENVRSPHALGLLPTFAQGFQRLFPELTGYGIINHSHYYAEEVPGKATHFETIAIHIMKADIQEGECS